MDASRKAQQQLDRSLKDREQQLKQKTDEWQGKETALFTKVTWCCLVAGLPCSCLVLPAARNTQLWCAMSCASGSWVAPIQVAGKVAPSVGWRPVIQTQ